MDDVIQTCSIVVDSAQFVSLDHDAIRNFANTLSADDLAKTEFTNELAELNEERRIAFILVFESICYSFWGEPKWTTIVDGIAADGSRAMTRALLQAIANGYDILSADYLQHISNKDFAIILDGNVTIPLFDARLAMLRALGTYITTSYNGSFIAFFDDTSWDAPTIVRKLVHDLPLIFDDSAKYHSKSVYFYKRAQLVPAKLHDLSQIGLISQSVRNVEQLTGFADYKVPQLLRRLGIVRYVPELAEKIDSYTELSSDSDEEIEIRAATIIALQHITSQAQQHIPTATAAKVDSALFLATQEKPIGDTPYHRSRTIWY